MVPAYCTNVHPAADLAGLLDQLDRYALPVRERLGIAELGLGLWLPAPVAAGLVAKPGDLRRLGAELAARGLSVASLNAFPYGDFHAPVVKHAVYRPDWTDRRRLDYTLDCARVLDVLLPADREGTLSTLPLGWRTPWGVAEDGAAERMLDELSRELGRFDRTLRLAMEPEPGCVLDTVADAVEWLAGRVDPARVGICLDTCHLAVSFADPVAEIERIAAAGLSVVKVQASAALHLDQPASPEVRAALTEFAEPRYLHQVRELAADGTVLAADDLPDALATLPGTGPWRVHFHLPLHAPPAGAGLSATTGVLIAALAALGEHRPHVEVETYTWSVLPGGRTEQDLIDGIAAELSWAARELARPMEVLN